MNRAEIGGLWAVEVHALGAVRVRQVRDLVEVNGALARARGPVDRMVVWVGSDFEEARQVELEVKRARREGG
jgi:hypothetical protein